MSSEMPTGGEWDLIDRIRRQVVETPSVPTGIGDDAAVVSVSADRPQLLVTTDMLLAGVHFDLSLETPYQVGRKALAVNLSDIAAMAGRPTAAFVGLVLPRSGGAQFADELMNGVLALAQEFEISIAGGDTNVWDGPPVISVTLLGEPTGPGPVLRSGAQPGDWLMVTGQLGGSLSHRRHLTFTPRVREAERLNTSLSIHAMIDLSDGLASDVRHLLTASNVGAWIDPLWLPIHPDVDQTLSAEVRRQRALSDGEDFELLFVLGPDDAQRLLAQPLFDTQVTKIGETVGQPGCWLVDDDGSRTLLEPAGWEHRFDEETGSSQ
jgi:thiamine-monophosphate kinase